MQSRLASIKWWFVLADLPVYVFRMSDMRSNATGGHQIFVSDEPLIQQRFKNDNMYAIWDDFHAAHGFLLLVCIALMTNVPYFGRCAMIAYANGE